MKMTSSVPRNACPPPSKAEILKALSPFAKPDDIKGMLLYSSEFLIYSLAIVAVLFSPSLGWKIVASLVAGLKLSAFVTLGHDAAHRMLVKNKTLNKWLAYACFIPCMHNYRMWIWDHHEVHHQQTNGEHFDSFTPYSKVEFDSLPWRKQVFERIIRSPNLVGFGIHYLFQRMPRVRIYPTKALPKRHRQSAWTHFAVLVAYHAAFLAMLSAAPGFAPISLGAALVLGYGLPFVVFGILVGGSLFLMHTHRNVPWFKGTLDRKGDAAAEYCSTYLTLPEPLSKLVHHVFAHSVHHAHPGVPCYHVLAAQECLDELLGERAVREPMSVRALIQTLNACKLYDFEAHQWLDFNGNPTTPRIMLRKPEPAAA
jgi:omega-6 fatty acid desaturase (delta-12 desaturase)